MPGFDVTKRRAALGGGGRGAVSGLNIRRSPEPARMIKALRQLIREDGTIEPSAGLLRKGAPDGR
jgi:DhnA family fructose-bisphosphate aldolase class Ia